MEPLEVLVLLLPTSARQSRLEGPEGRHQLVEM
jgi:hypothetical protein